ncbi:MAG: hypothetical protein ABI850_07225 [Flavobacterium sp.]
MKKQKIEEIFSSMEDFSSVPPAELWGQIEEKLDKPKKKKRAILWWSAAACLLLGLMLPSVLHFNSGSGIKNVNTDATENNSIVQEENKGNSKLNKTIPIEKNTIDQHSGNTKTVTSEDIENQSAVSKEKEQTQNTAVAHADAKNETNSNSAVTELKSEKKNTNPTVGEKTVVSKKENTFNTASKNQIADTENTKPNQNTAKKAVNTKENTFNPTSKNQIADSQRKSNQTIVEKPSISKKDEFNSISKNQSAFQKRNTNQGLAESPFIAKDYLVNSASKNQTSDTEKRKANQILAEKTFSSGKQNPFNPTSKNQILNSLFEEKQYSKSNKNNSLALNSSNTILSDQQNKIDKSGEESKNEMTIAGKSFIENQKSNSKFNDVLSKQDSVQLAELQNLEKGIINPEVQKDKEKEIKAISNAEKWAVEVFAGVANSENYKNDKTLGHTNDSKQSNTYGVKTKYKINKKWAVGSGFKINELGQSIANVSYMNVKPKNNVLATYNDYYIQNSTAPQIATNSDYVFVSNSTKEVLKSDNLQSGNLDQSLRYIEMPLEVSYAVFSKNKTSISLNTGGFVGKLISNKVALDGNSIGENIDANDFVYGSVLSSTIQYRIYKKTNVFVEPAMNYYLNPLSNQSFNQFQWGLNFGLNVSF